MSKPKPRGAPTPEVEERKRSAGGSTTAGGQQLVLGGAAVSATESPLGTEKCLLDLAHRCPE